MSVLSTISSAVFHGTEAAARVAEMAVFLVVAGVALSLAFAGV